MLAACEAVTPAPLEIHVVVGPYFSPALRQEIENLAAASRHRVSLIEAPEDLRAEMLWCDLAIATSGLTKYELAATGTPTVLLSHDAAHAKNNEAFAALGISLDLGEASRLSSSAISEAVSGLLQDSAGREEMSRRGRATVDGAGVERIIDVIEEMTA
jgi:spore coat polysaccharide biosynthesis predicted glycosyltransferase SpsG